MDEARIIPAARRFEALRQGLHKGSERAALSRHEGHFTRMASVAKATGLHTLQVRIMKSFVPRATKPPPAPAIEHEGRGLFHLDPTFEPV